MFISYHILFQLSYARCMHVTLLMSLLILRLSPEIVDVLLIALVLSLGVLWKIFFLMLLILWNVEILI